MAIGSAVVGALVALDPRRAQSQTRHLDVPYVPTPEHVVEAMLRLAKPTPSDFLVDLGCGDGRIVVTAAEKYGVRGFGVDLNPERIKEARANAAKAKVTDKVEFVEGDLFKTDFRKATVLTMYLLPQVNMALRPSILAMKPGTRVVSHAFHMEDWQPDAKDEHGFRVVYYWIVPGKAGGKWSGTIGSSRLELELGQSFQMVSGTARVDGKPATLTNGRITGETITFDITMPDGRQRRLTGRIGERELAGDGWKVAAR
jgi:precorrin-6B methylase 2